MALLPSQAYTSLRDKVLDKGEATMTVTISPLHFQSVRNFFMNKKNRDVLHKHKFMPFTYTENIAQEEPNIVVYLSLSPAYVIESTDFNQVNSKGDTALEFKVGELPDA